MCLGLIQQCHIKRRFSNLDSAYLRKFWRISSDRQVYSTRFDRWPSRIG
jgi:hypothetical protein